MIGRKFTWIAALAIAATGCGKSVASSESTPQPASKGAGNVGGGKKDESTSAPKGAAPSADGLAGSCDYRAIDSSCAEYMAKVLDESGATPDLQQQLCEANKGVWSTEHCAKEKTLGKCTDDEGYIRIYYTTGKTPYDAASAKGACYGKWEPNP